MHPITEKKFHGKRFKAIAGPMEPEGEDKVILGKMIADLLRRGRRKDIDFTVERRKVQNRREIGKQKPAKHELWLWLSGELYLDGDSTDKRKREAVKGSFVEAIIGTRR